MYAMIDTVDHKSKLIMALTMGNRFSAQIYSQQPKHHFIHEDW